MQNTTPVDHGDVERAVGVQEPPERQATVWVSRLTGAVGGSVLIIALFIWFARSGHYRLVLALLTVAMFCAILHSYVFEDTA